MAPALFDNGRGRLLAVILIPISLTMAIEHQRAKTRMLDKALYPIQENDRLRQSENQLKPDEPKRPTIEQ